MIIKRVLNHNAAISTNHQGLDILLMGKGIAFKKKVGDSIDVNAIETSFVLKKQREYEPIYGIVYYGSARGCGVFGKDYQFRENQAREDAG